MFQQKLMVADMKPSSAHLYLNIITLQKTLKQYYGDLNQNSPTGLTYTHTLLLELFAKVRKPLESAGC